VSTFRLLIQNRFAGSEQIDAMYLIKTEEEHEVQEPEEGLEDAMTL